jgi:hypothetical protein
MLRASGATRDPVHITQTALDSMCHSTEELLALLDGASDSQWHLRPAGEEWSLAETAEHVVLSNCAILARLGRLLAASLARDATHFDDAKITADMFRIDGPAPALAVPTGRFATRAEGVAALTAACDGISAWAKECPEELRAHGLPHPIFGFFDGVQWILFVAAHTDNHAEQLRVIRAHPEFANAGES